jgi:hypothetical protein
MIDLDVRWSFVGLFITAVGRYSVLRKRKRGKGSGNWVVKQEEEIGIRIVYLVCYAMMLCSRH